MLQSEASMKRSGNLMGSFGKAISDSYLGSHEQLIWMKCQFEAVYFMLRRKAFPSIINGCLSDLPDISLGYTYLGCPADIWCRPELEPSAVQWRLSPPSLRQTHLDSPLCASHFANVRLVPWNDFFFHFVSKLSRVKSNKLGKYFLERKCFRIKTTRNE